MDKNIISVSRKTDIPAFYLDWFLKRLKEGYAVYQNPFGGQFYRVSLLPDEVEAFVFWSKDFGSFLNRAMVKILNERFEGRFFCHFTITGYAEGTLRDVLEPGVPLLNDALSTFKRLSEACGDPRKIHWRFDPIILTDRTSEDFFYRQAERIGSVLEGYTDRCFFSFVDLYKKVEKNFVLLKKCWGLKPVHPSREVLTRMAGNLFSILKPKGIQLFACCEDEVVDEEAVKKGHCVDAELVRKVFPGQAARVPLRPTRRGCGCSLSRDIGAYETCLHGCPYCYANSNAQAVSRNSGRMDPGFPLLCPSPKVRRNLSFSGLV